MRVMVVEDSIMLRERAVDVLNGIVGEQSVSEAGSVKEAIEKLAEFQPEIVILDLLLPDGHGLDILTSIQSTRKATYVLVMTAEPSEQYRRRAFQLGATHFFDKMKDFEQVFLTVADITNHFSKEIQGLEARGKYYGN